MHRFHTPLPHHEIARRRVWVMILSILFGSAVCIFTAASIASRVRALTASPSASRLFGATQPSQFLNAEEVFDTSAEDARLNATIEQMKSAVMNEKLK